MKDVTVVWKMKTERDSHIILIYVHHHSLVTDEGQSLLYDGNTRWRMNWLYLVFQIGVSWHRRETTSVLSWTPPDSLRRLQRE